MSFNGTENIIQNYCVTFSHTFPHSKCRIKNTFVIKAADVTEEKALKIAQILFDKPDIKIEKIENDELTLTPSEYDFICGQLTQLAPKTEKFDKYVSDLVKKMKSRMEQFPVYHT